MRDPRTSSGSDFATVAYDTSTGAQAWVSHYDGGGGVSNDDRAFALGVSPDDSKVFVTGTSFRSETSYDFATVAISAE